ncbi:MAG: transferase [Armatimonadota bacterium]|nr:MAG: transferase [Armatimonadota bacterium]
MRQPYAIIPARGGSKGITRKNLQPVGGVPLIGRAILAARGSQHVQGVFVSTDDAEIAEAAKRYGAEVIWRPAELATDTASSEAALLHALHYLREERSLRVDLLVFIQCTSPFIESKDIDAMIEKLEDGNGDCIFTVTRFHGFVWKVDSQLGAVGVNHDRNVRLRRQEREPQFLETGAVYIMRADGFLQYKHRFFGKVLMYEVPSERSLEIDEPADLLLANMLWQRMYRENQRRTLPDKVEAIVMDFDGVFTDNRVLVLQDGSEGVLCSRSDGWGIARLKERGIPIVVISSETNPVVEARCRKLGIECLTGVADKLSVMWEWLQRRGVSSENNVVYIGNDVNDLACMQAVGCAVAPSDAHPQVLEAADVVLQAKGGQGALRELAEMVLQQRE